MSMLGQIAQMNPEGKIWGIVEGRRNSSGKFLEPRDFTLNSLCAFP